MTATDELRRLLDERGAEYKANDIMGLSETCWDSTYAFQLSPDSALMMRVTPEQAVEATLGRRTCRRMPSADDATVMVRRGCFEVEFPYFECSECGSYVMDNARYCPICGARVVA